MIQGEKMAFISSFFGIIIKMYYNEHNPPHFHAEYQGFHAIFDIKKSCKVKGKFPNKAEKIVSEWAIQRRPELLDNWQRMSKGQTFRRIKGADQ